MSWNEKSGSESRCIRMFSQFFSHRFKQGMEVVLAAGRFWPPSWTGCFLVRKAVRTTYQFLHREMDVFVRQICFENLFLATAPLHEKVGGLGHIAWQESKIIWGLREKVSNRSPTSMLNGNVLKWLLSVKTDRIREEIGENICSNSSCSK